MKKHYVFFFLALIFSFALVGSDINNSENNTYKLQERSYLTMLSPSNEMEMHPDPSFEIKLLNGFFIPKAGVGIDITNIEKENTGEEIYALVQFQRGLIDSDAHDFLENQNSLELGRVPDNTYVIKIPINNLKNFFESYLIRWINILQPEQKIHPNIAEQDESLEVLVTAFENMTQDQIEKISVLSEEVIFDGKDSESILVKATYSNIFKIAKLNFIQWISPRGTGKTSLDNSARVISVPYVWSQGNTASDVTVGIIDSGLDFDHPHFFNPTIPIYKSKDWVDGGMNPEDEQVHGTLMAGTISGSGSSSSSSRYYKGISNRAALTIEKAFDSHDDWVAPHPALNPVWNWILDPNQNFSFNDNQDADIINNSWAHYFTYGAYEQASQKVDKVVRGELSNGKKIVVVFGSGNDHAISNGAGVEPPATAKNAITVGASADFRSSTEESQYSQDFCPPDSRCNYDSLNGYVMEYSGRGTLDGRVKPDILAPGSTTFGPVAQTTVYASGDGTSAAAAHVSAVAAQILQAYSTASPALVKALLVNNAVGAGTTDNKNYDEGWGRLSAFESIYWLTDDYTATFNEFNLGGPGTGLSNEGYLERYVPADADRIVVTMAYDDEPSFLLGSVPTLKNNIDLYLQKPNGSQLYVNDDSVNNVEKYVIDDPDEGNWRFYVKFVNPQWLSTQDAAMNLKIIRKTQPSSTDILSTSGPINVDQGENFKITANVHAVGLVNYDMWTRIDVPNGLTLTLPGFYDSMDGDKNVLGDIPADVFVNTGDWVIRADDPGTYNVRIYAQGKRKDGSNIFEVDTTVVNVNPTEKDPGDLCSSHSECGTGYCEGSASNPARCCVAVPPQDGWYGGGNTSTAQCGVVDNDAASIYRDYYCDASGSAQIEPTDAQDCDSSDGWYGGGNTAGCGDDPSSIWRDYYVTTNDNTCTYTESCNGNNSFDCDAQDACAPYCSGNTAIFGTDYYVVENTNTCTSIEESEDCTVKDSTDSDGGNIPLTFGSVLDYDACSNGGCIGTQHDDVCTTSTDLTEFFDQGTSFSSQAYSCNDFETLAVDPDGDDPSVNATCIGGTSATCSVGKFDAVVQANGTDQCQGTCGLGENSCSFVEFYVADSADACTGLDSCAQKTYDADTAENTCNTCLGSNHWNIGGEVSSSCCGDDASEYKNTRVCVVNVCSTDNGDGACCLSNNSCVYNNTCYADGFRGDVDLDTNQEFCNNGIWSEPPKDVWKTFLADSGSASADITEDVLSVLSGAGISTSIVGDVLTVTNTVLNGEDLDGVSALFGGIGIDVNPNKGDVTVSIADVVALLSGRSGGQTLSGGINAGENLNLESTSDSTKGLINLLDDVRVDCSGDANVADLTACGTLRWESAQSGLIVSPVLEGAGKPGIITYLDNELYLGANSATGLIINEFNDVIVGSATPLTGSKLNVIDNLSNKIALKLAKDISNAVVPVVQIRQDNPNAGSNVLNLVQNDSDESFMKFTGSKGNVLSIDSNLDKKITYMLKTEMESGVSENVFVPVFVDAADSKNVTGFSNATGNFSTVSTQFVDVTNPADFNITLTKKSTVILTAMIPHTNTVTNSFNRFRWVFGNNTSSSMSQKMHGAVYTTRVPGIFKNVEPGTYNVKLQMEVSAGTGIIGYTPGNSVAQLIAVSYEE